MCSSLHDYVQVPTSYVQFLTLLCVRAYTVIIQGNKTRRRKQAKVFAKDKNVFLTNLV